MLRGRSALARVCLCLVCLLGLTAAEYPTRGLLKQIKSLIKIAPQEDSGCRLYTPTAADYRKCPSSSLTCFSEESQVLIEEWKIAGVTKNRRYELEQGLEELASQLNETESGCSRCELLPEEEPKTFLLQLQGILQRLNSPS